MFWFLCGRIMMHQQGICTRLRDLEYVSVRIKAARSPAADAAALDLLDLPIIHNATSFWTRFYRRFTWQRLGTVAAALALANSELLLLRALGSWDAVM